jgi:4-hydroxy-tetrahydrodipicolinate synthase
VITSGSPMTAAMLRGIIPALITPLDEHGEPDEASIQSLIEFQIDAGVTALFVLGSTGEGPLLSTEQKLRVVRATVESNRGRLPVMVGISNTSPAESVAFGRLAHRAGANALVTTVPFYYLHSQAELPNYFRYLKQRLDLPIATYDVPSAVKIKLAASTVRTIAEEGLVIGIKDSSGDLAGFREVVTGTRALPGFSALTGSELTVDSALALGADGAVPGLANVDPDGYVRLHRLCRTGDWDRARAEQERLCALFRMTGVGDPARMGGSSAALGAFKAALHLRGVIDCPATAEPQVPLSEAETECVGKFLAGAGLM